MLYKTRLTKYSKPPVFKRYAKVKVTTEVATDRIEYLYKLKNHLGYIEECMVLLYEGRFSGRTSGSRLSV